MDPEHLNTDIYRFKAFCMFPRPKIGDVVIIFCIFLSFGLKRIGIRIYYGEEEKKMVSKKTVLLQLRER
jgi:hypothetical protein